MEVSKKWNFFSIRGLNGRDIFLAFVCDIILSFEVLLKVVNKEYNLSFSYDELIAGLVSIQGYNKKNDLILIRLLFIELIIGMYLFCLCIKLYKEEKVGITLWYTVIGVLASCFLIPDEKYYLIFSVCAILLFLLCKNTDLNKENRNYKASLIFLSCGFLSYTSLKYFLSLHGISGQVYSILKILGVIVVLVFFVLMKTNFFERTHKIFVFTSQIMIPVFLLCIYTYTYSYGDELITLHQSIKLKAICIVLLLIFTVWSCYRIKRYPDEMFLPTTFIVAPMIVWYKQPYGAITIDWFTYGEWTMPLQQLMSFGKLPYVDVYPVHGLCDYFYSILNYVLFWGKFSEIYICEFIGNLIMIGVIGYLLFAFSKNKMLSYILMVFVSPQLSGWLRFFAGTIYIIVLFSEKCEKNKFLRLRLWIYLSIFCVLWYPTIGACFALAFAPVVLYGIIKEPWYYLGKVKEEKKSVVTLLIVICACVPILLSILKYILAEAGYSEVIQGQRILEEVANSALANLDCWIVALGVCLWSLILFGNMLKSKKFIEEIDLFVFLVCFGLLIMSYIFCASEGRGIMMSRCILPVIILLVCNIMLKDATKDDKLYIIAIIAVPTVALCCNSYSTIFDLQGRSIVGKDLNLDLDNKTPIEFVYVNGDDYGVKNLGEGYLPEDLIYMIEDGKLAIDEICGEDGIFVDFGSMPALYYLFDMENITKYTSNIIMGTKEIQESVISLFEDREPTMMSLFPHCHLFVTDGIRNIYMWNWAIENGYVIRQNKSDRGCGYSVFLVKPENDSDNFMDGTAFVQSIFDEMGDYGWIPYLWGKDTIHETEMVEIESSSALTHEGDNWSYDIYMEDISGKLVDFLRVNADYSGTILIEGIDAAGNKLMTESCSMLTGQDILFPLIASPNWVYCDNISQIKIIFTETTDEVPINGYNFEEIR